MTSVTISESQPNPYLISHTNSLLSALSRKAVTIVADQMDKSEVQAMMTAKLQETFMRDPSSSAEVLTKFLLNVTAADVHR